MQTVMWQFTSSIQTAVMVELAVQQFSAMETSTAVKSTFGSPQL